MYCSISFEVGDSMLLSIPKQGSLVACPDIVPVNVIMIGLWGTND